MSHRHEHAQFYTPVDPDTRCNCGECYECRLGQAQAKVDNAAAEVAVLAWELTKAQARLTNAQVAHAEALERLAEVKP